MELIIGEAVPVLHCENCHSSYPAQVQAMWDSPPRCRPLQAPFPPVPGGAGSGPPSSTSKRLDLQGVIFSPFLGLSLHCLEGHLGLKVFGLQLNRNL